MPTKDDFVVTSQGFEDPNALVNTSRQSQDFLINKQRLFEKFHKGNKENPVGIYTDNTGTYYNVKGNIVSKRTFDKYVADNGITEDQITLHGLGTPEGREELGFSGQVLGAGGPKSDVIDLNLQQGTTVIPAEYTDKFKEIYKKYIGKEPMAVVSNAVDGNTNASNGEFVVSPEDMTFLINKKADLSFLPDNVFIPTPNPNKAEGGVVALPPLPKGYSIDEESKLPPLPEGYSIEGDSKKKVQLQVPGTDSYAPQEPFSVVPQKSDSEVLSISSLKPTSYADDRSLSYGATKAIKQEDIDAKRREMRGALKFDTDKKNKIEKEVDDINLKIHDVSNSLKQISSAKNYAPADQVPQMEQQEQALHKQLDQLIPVSEKNTQIAKSYLEKINQKKAELDKLSPAGYVGGAIKEATLSTADVVKSLGGVAKFVNEMQGLNIPDEANVFYQMAEGIKGFGNKVNDMPDTMAGKILGGVSAAAPLIVETALLPVASAITLPTALGINGFGKAYSETNSFKDAAKEGAIGVAEGAIFHGLGVGSNKLGEIITKGESPVMSKSIAATLAGGGFGGAAVAEKYFNGEEVTWNDFMAGAGTGLAFELPGLGKAMYSKAFSDVLSVSPEAVKQAVELPTSVEELRAKATEIAEKAVDIKDPQEKQQAIMTANSLNNTANIKAVAPVIAENPQPFIEDIKASDLSDQKKAQGIDHIQQISIDNDPNNTEAKPIVDKVDYNTSIKQKIENDANMDQVQKKTRIDAINKENEGLQEQLDFVYQKQKYNVDSRYMDKADFSKKIGDNQFIQDVAEGKIDVKIDNDSEMGKLLTDKIQIYEKEKRQEEAEAKILEAKKEGGKEVTPSSETKTEVKPKTETNATNEGKKPEGDQPEYSRTDEDGTSPQSGNSDSNVGGGNVTKNEAKEIDKLTGKDKSDKILSLPDADFVDRIINDGFFNATGQTLEYRTDFGMTTADVKKAVKDIKSGKDSAPARQLKEKILEIKKTGQVPQLFGTGGATERTNVPLEEYYKDDIPDSDEISEQENEYANSNIPPMLMEDIGVGDITLENLPKLKEKLFSGFPFTEADYNNVKTHLENEATNKTSETVTESETVSEQSKQPEEVARKTDKEVIQDEIKTAKEALRQKLGGGLRSGLPADALPELINLAKAYIKLGIQNVKELIEYLKKDFPDLKDFDEKELEEKVFNEAKKQFDRENKKEAISDKVKEMPKEQQDKLLTTSKYVHEQQRKDIENSKKSFGRHIYEKFMRGVVDTKALMRNTLTKAGATEAAMRKDLVAGSSAKAKEEFSKYKKEIFDGLDKEKEQELNDIIQAKRIIAIDSRYDELGKPRIAHPGKLSLESEQVYLNDLKQKDVKAYEDLNGRSEKYFDAMREQLKNKYEEGRITKEAYDKLSTWDYSPRIFLENMIDAETKPKGVFKEQLVSKDDIKRLSEGDVESLYNDSRWMLENHVLSTNKAIFENKANRALYEFASQNPKNGFVEVEGANRVEEGGEIKRDERGQPEYSEKAPAGYTKIQFFENGERKSMFLKNEIASEWLNADPVIKAEVANAIRLSTGGSILRAFATGINPAFALANIPKDMLHALMFSNTYSPTLPKGLAQLSRDMFKVSKDVFKRKGRLKEAIDEGLGMEWLTHQGKPLTTGSLSKGASGEAMKTFNHVAGYINETSELITRIAIREREIDTRLEDFRKNNGRDPNKKELEKIKSESTAVARKIMDFAQGGEWTKMADNFIPYLNASFQGLRVGTNYIKNNPKEFAYKLAQLGIATAGLVAYNTDFEEWKDVPDYVKANNFIVMLPFTSEDKYGNKTRMYISIPKANDITPFTGFFEGITELAKDGKYPTKTSVKALENVIPNIDPRNVPIVDAMNTYVSNYNRLTDKTISYNKDKVLPEEEFTKNTPKIFKDIGEATEMSPERLKVASSKVLTNPEGNIYFNLIAKPYDLVTEGMSDKEKKEVNKSMLEHLQDVLGPLYRRYVRETNPYVAKKERDKEEREKKRRDRIEGKNTTATADDFMD